jgi:hypothetical protein
LEIKRKGLARLVFNRQVLKTKSISMSIAITGDFVNDLLISYKIIKSAY